MKRFLISLCAVVLCLTLVGCSSSSLPAHFSMGTTEGLVYENSFIGLGCQLPEGFAFTSAEELEDLNEVTPDMSEDERNTLYSQADTLYLMQANNEEGGGVGINLENTEAKGATVTSAKGYMATAKNELPSAMQSMGFTDVTITENPLTFAGKEYNALQVSGSIYEEKFFQNYICYEVDKYLVIVSYGAYGEDVVKALTEAFYAI